MNWDLGITECSNCLLHAQVLQLDDSWSPSAGNAGIPETFAKGEIEHEGW